MPKNKKMGSAWHGGLPKSKFDHEQEQEDGKCLAWRVARKQVCPCPRTKKGEAASMVKCLKTNLTMPEIETGENISMFEQQKASFAMI